MFQGTKILPSHSENWAEGNRAYNTVMDVRPHLHHTFCPHVCVKMCASSNIRQQAFGIMWMLGQPRILRDKGTGGKPLKKRKRRRKKMKNGGRRKKRRKRRRRGRRRGGGGGRGREEEKEEKEEQQQEKE